MGDNNAAIDRIIAQMSNANTPPVAVPRPITASAHGGGGGNLIILGAAVVAVLLAVGLIAYFLIRWTRNASKPKPRPVPTTATVSTTSVPVPLVVAPPVSQSSPDAPATVVSPATAQSLTTGTAQQAQLQPATTIIQGVRSTACLTIGGTPDGQALTIQDCQGQDEQMFAWDSSQRIVSKKTGQCLGTAPNSSILAALACGDAPTFKWERQGVALKQQGSGTCIEVLNGSSLQGTNLQLSTCQGIQAQSLFQGPDMAGYAPVQVISQYGDKWGRKSQFEDERAQWIWSRDDNARSVKFRYVFISNVPGGMAATLHVIADDEGAVSLNDTQVGGINQQGWLSSNYSKMKVTLPTGLNILDVSVTNKAGAGGFLMSCISETDKQVLFHTDQTWMATKN